jgi:SpoVK/Ycf46/Vps4 family AAA+-type ATPase
VSGAGCFNKAPEGSLGPISDDTIGYALQRQSVLGGRFSEKIELGIPDDAGYLRLTQKYLDGIPLAAGLTPAGLLYRLRGISPADLRAVVNTAKRMAYSRTDENAVQLSLLIWEDFQHALKRNRAHFSDVHF